jgi:hypothetical protein
MAFVGNIIARIGADTRPLNQGLKGAIQSLSSFQRSSTSTLGAAKNAMLAATAAIAAGFAFMVKSGVSDAIKYEAALQRVRYMFGASAKDIVAWSENTANAFNMSRYEAIQYSAVYGNLLSTITTDNKKLFDYTTELLKASAIVASSTGRDMQDVMERIRSGLLGNTEAIEDLGVSIMVNMIESTEAFKKFANGKSWDQLSFQTQQQIRLFAILEQVSMKFGDSIYQNTASSIGKLTSVLKDAALNIGLAFLPAINMAMPYLISFAETIKTLTGYFMQFMQVVFGVSTKQAQATNATMSAAKAQTNLGNATKKAGDKAKNSIMGFDEVNQLQKDMADSAGDASDAMDQVGGGGAGALATPDLSGADSADSGLAKMQEKLNEIKASAANYALKLGITLSEEDVALVSSKMQEVKEKLAPAVQNLFTSMQSSIQTLKPVLEGFISGAWNIFKTTVLDVLKSDNYSITIDNIKGAIDNYASSITSASNILSGFGEIMSNIFSEKTPMLSSAISNLVSGYYVFGSSILNVMTSIVRDGFDVLDKAISGNADHFQNILGPAMDIVSGIITILGETFSAMGMGLKKTYDENIGPMKALFLDVFGTAMSLLDQLVNTWIIPAVMPAIIELKNTIGPAFSEIWASISSAIGSGIVLLQMLWENILKPLTVWFQDNIMPVWGFIFTEIGNRIKDVMQSVIAIVKNYFELIKNVLDFIKNVFQGDWEKAWTNVGNIFELIFKNLVNVARIPLNTIIRMVNSLFDKLASIKIQIPTVEIPGLGKMGGGSVGFPQIPHIPEIPALAQGGIISSPTLAMVGEAGAEAVVPLENTGFVDNLASAIGNAVISAMQFSQNSKSQESVNVYMDTTQVARILIPAMARENQRIGTTAIIQSI